MNNTEIKDALMDGRSVMNNGILYDRVNAIIYRNNNGKIAVSAELLDKNSRCIVVASVDKIQNVEA